MCEGPPSAPLRNNSDRLPIPWSRCILTPLERLAGQSKGFFNTTYPGQNQRCKDLPQYILNIFLSTPTLFAPFTLCEAHFLLNSFCDSTSRHTTGPLLQEVGLKLGESYRLPISSTKPFAYKYKRDADQRTGEDILTGTNFLSFPTAPTRPFCGALIIVQGTLTFVKPLSRFDSR